MIAPSATEISIENIISTVNLKQYSLKLMLLSPISFLFMQNARIALELRTDSLTATAATKAAAAARGKNVIKTANIAVLP